MRFKGLQMEEYVMKCLKSTPQKRISQSPRFREGGKPFSHKLKSSFPLTLIVRLAKGNVSTITK